jgi:hypothetical protein
MEALRLWRMEAGVNPYREPYVYDMERKRFPWHDTISWAVVAIACAFMSWSFVDWVESRSVSQKRIRDQAAHCHRFGGVLVREAGTNDLVCSPVFPVPAEK